MCISISRKVKILKFTQRNTRSGWVIVRMLGVSMLMDLTKTDSAYMTLWTKRLATNAKQKTLGHHAECSKCSKVTGQFCGDCLYTRYGENGIEVNQNPGWICPVCRGICNCSRCRREKGWAPTGAIYKKVVNLGFKSVAHYLVYTRLGQSCIEVAAGDGPPTSVEGSLSNDDGKQESSDAPSTPEEGGKKNKKRR